MAFATLLVLLAVLQTSITGRSKHLSKRDELCLCGDPGIKPQSLAMNDKDSSPVSCNKTCSTKTNVCSSKAPQQWMIKHFTVVFQDMYRENTSGWPVEVSWSPITGSPQNWSGYCIYLSPEFREDSYPVTKAFLLKNQTSMNITIPRGKVKVIYVAGYALPLFPDTSLAVERLQLDAYRPHVYVSTRPASEVDFSYERTTAKKSKDSVLYLAISISVGVLVGIGLVVGLVVYFLRHKAGKHKNPLPQDFRYHAFIIYNSGDQRWMETKLLPLLEEKHHLTCCIHYRDFTAGKPFRDCMAESVYNSYKVIALFSSNFVKSNYCKYELDLAIGRLVSHRDSCLAVIKIDEVDCNILPEELKHRSFIDYSNAIEKPNWKRKLLEFLHQPGDEQYHDSDVNQNCRSNTNDDNRARLESASSMESDAHQEHPKADMEEISDFSSTNSNRERIRFVRLESTISNDTVMSVL